MRFGLVGAGAIGEVRARALRRNHKLVAIADIDSSRAGRVAQSTHQSDASIYDDFRRLIDDQRVEAVIVSTPPSDHETVAKAALEAGKHVLCEKPLAASVAVCRGLVETARARGRVLATGFNHRYFPAVQFVKAAIDEQKIGALDHVRAFAGHTGLSEFKAPWMYDRKVMGGGALMDNGIHLIDLTRYLLGEVDEVFGVATSRVWRLDGVEDNGFAWLHSTEGRHATLQASWTEWKGYRFYVEAYGDRGMARAYYAPMMSAAVYLDEPGGRRRRSFRSYPWNILREKVRGWQSTVERTFEAEFNDFEKLCRGEKGLTIADGVAGMRAVEIANAVYRSSTERRIVRVDEPF